MAGIKQSFLALVLLTSGCKSVEAAGSRPASEILVESASEAVKTVPSAGSQKVSLPLKAEAKGSAVLLRWQLGRYSQKLVGEESVEVKDKVGRKLCEISESVAQKVLGDKRLMELKAAIETLALSKGEYGRNPIFRGYDESRELLAFNGGEEFLVEQMYQAQEILRPKPKVDPEAFDEAMALVMTAARDKKLCPDLGG